VAWAVAVVAASLRLRRARRGGDPARELAARRTLGPLLAFEHAALATALATGLALMAWRGWGIGQARWLGLKLGLVAFLLVPLEGMHAYICHVWVARGLRQTDSPPFSKDLERGIGMDDMLRALAVPLLLLALPLLLWLSLRKPW
jgi:hypothetical protein